MEFSKPPAFRTERPQYQHKTFFFFFSPKGKKEVLFFFCFHVRTPENRGAFEFASSHNSFKQIIRRGDPHELLCPSLCSTRASFQFLRLLRPYLLPPFVFSSNFCLLHKVELRSGTKVKQCVWHCDKFYYLNLKKNYFIIVFLVEIDLVKYIFS